MSATSGIAGAFYCSKQTAFTSSTANDYATVTDPTGGELDFSSDSSFAIEFWERHALQSDAAILIDKGLTAASDAGYAITIDAADGITFGVDDGTASPSVVSAAVASDTWNHVVAVRDGTNDKIKVYVNGTKVQGSDTTTATLASASDLSFGRSADTVALGYVRIYNTTPTDAHVSDLWKGNLPSDLYDNIVGEWLMFEGSGSDLHDSSGNSNDGVVQSDAAGAWATDTYNTATAEAVGTGDGSTKQFAFDNKNVLDTGLTVTVGGSAQVIEQDFTLTPEGIIRFTTAPAGAAAVVATYRYNPMTFESGGFTSWSMDYVADTLETTDFVTGGNRTFVRGLKSWSGSAERHWVNKMTANLLTERCILKFYISEASAKYYTGWGIISGINVSASVDALVDESVSFQGTRALEIV